jgi:peptidoglycan/LPS O-acetylase OafA/YrhL
MAVLASMFLGTAIYRAEHRQITRLKAGLVFIFVATALLLSGTWLGQREQHTLNVAWLTAMLATWGVFLAALALRNRSIPRLLTWLGEISYSVYLVHAVILTVLLRLIGANTVTSMPMIARIGLGLLFCGIVVAVSQVTFRLIEQPAQRFGRRLVKRLDRPNGIPTQRTGRPVPAPAD